MIFISTYDNHGKVRESKADLGESSRMVQVLSNHLEDHLKELLGWLAIFSMV